MARLTQEEPCTPARDLPFLVLCVAAVPALFRTVDQPSVSLSIAGSDVTLVPADLALAALGLPVVYRLLGRGSLPQPARALTAAAALFAAWLLVSSAVNGADAFVGAAKLLEYGLLALGAVLFVHRRVHFWLVVLLLVGVTAAADLYALVEFAENPGERQSSFLGAHDFAALGSMTLTVGIASLYVRNRARAWITLAAGVSGAIAVVLGAALASLLGLYLAIAAIVAIAAARRALATRAVVVTLVVAAAVTAGAVSLRDGDLGFLQKVAPAEQADVPGDETAGGWSQRLVYAYIGGRVFLANPVLGTGWHGEFPPSEFARFLPAARERFPEQPPHYFPAGEGKFTPQQTYDQVLYELGLVGALLFLALAVIAARTAARVGVRWPHDAADEELAYVPAAWVASLAGALAGAALFGGIPLAAIFWLTLGVAALAPSLVPPSRVPARRIEPREPAVAAT